MALEKCYSLVRFCSLWVKWLQAHSFLLLSAFLSKKWKRITRVSDRTRSRDNLFSSHCVPGTHPFPCLLFPYLIPLIDLWGDQCSPGYFNNAASKPELEFDPSSTREPWLLISLCVSPMPSNMLTLTQVSCHRNHTSHTPTEEFSSCILLYTFSRWIRKPQVIFS